MGLLSLGKVQLPTRGGFSFATVKYPTLGELQALLVSCPAAAAFPVIVAGRLPRRTFRGLLGVHCTLRPARPADPRREPFLGVFQPICRLLDRPKCFRLGRASPVGICTRGFKVPWQGTHNNAAERALRPIAVGRNNWLFVGSATGGQTAAVLFSFTSTSRRLNLDPFAYLRDVLNCLAAGPLSADELSLLLPHRWTPPSTS